MDTRTERIRALNDRLRATGEGGNVVITRGLAALDAEILAENNGRRSVLRPVHRRQRPVR